VDIYSEILCEAVQMPLIRGLPTNWWFFFKAKKNKKNNNNWEVNYEEFQSSCLKYEFPLQDSGHFVKVNHGKGFIGTKPLTILT